MKNGSFTNFWFMRSRHWFVIPESRTLNSYPDSFWFMILVIRNKLLQERFWKVNFVRHISYICYYFCETFRSNLQFPTIRLVQIVKFAKCKICCLQLKRRWFNEFTIFREHQSKTNNAERSRRRFSQDLQSKTAHVSVHEREGIVITIEK